MKPTLLAAALVIVTAGPAVCVHRWLRARTGRLGSVAVAASVTFVPPATDCEGPAATTGGPIGGSTSTVVNAVAAGAAPLVAVNEKPRVTGAIPTVKTGAVKVGVNVF